jgi:hypothetical protein
LLFVGGDSNAPLSDREKAAFAHHLEFLRRYRKLLRLRLNANENLIVDGAREPENRGICQHLLAKVAWVAAFLFRPRVAAATSRKMRAADRCLRSR